MVDTSSYKVGLIVAIKDCGSCKTKGKLLRECTIRVNPNDENDTVTVVTSAANVREGSRIVVASEGSVFINHEGEELTVKKATVGGVVSEGMLCDSNMLGWSGGAKGVAVQVPDNFELGVAPPTSKPRIDGGGDATAYNAAAGGDVQGIFERKLTKEEKKKLAEERRRAKKEAKAAKAGAEEGDEGS